LPLSSGQGADAVPIKAGDILSYRDTVYNKTDGKLLSKTDETNNPPTADKSFYTTTHKNNSRFHFMPNKPLSVITSNEIYGGVTLPDYNDGYELTASHAGVISNTEKNGIKKYTVQEDCWLSVITHYHKYNGTWGAVFVNGKQIIAFGYPAQTGQQHFFPVSKGDVVTVSGWAETISDGIPTTETIIEGWFDKIWCFPIKDQNLKIALPDYTKTEVVYGQTKFLDNTSKGPDSETFPEAGWTAPHDGIIHIAPIYGTRIWFMSRVY
jgi:hypothetical protein